MKGDDFYYGVMLGIIIGVLISFAALVMNVVNVQ